METILLILAIGTINALCFFLGAKLGQKVVRGETIESPLKSPLESLREAKDNFEYRQEQERLQTISDNIDNYDGTGIGQKDIPGR
jgi:hypothetical protein